MKLERRHHILQRLQHGPVASQEALVAELAARGEVVTQATVSRDLRALGAVKGPEGYVLPDAAVAGGRLGADPGEAELTRQLRRHAISVELADAIVVVRTAAGHASGLARAIDAAPPRGVVGTVAGDDTIFLACTSRNAARTVRSGLRRRRRGER